MSTTNSTVFSDGTAILAPWMNDVNYAIFGGVSRRLSQYSGADHTGITDSSSQLNQAISEVSALGGGEVFIDGTYAFSDVTPKSNVTIRGVRGFSVLTQIQPSSLILTGIHTTVGFGTLSNFIIDGITFQGNRTDPATAHSPFNNVIYLNVGAGDVLTNIQFINCDFHNAQGDCIRIWASDITASGSIFRVTGCSGQIDDAHRFDSAALPLVDLIRIGQSGGAGGGADLSGGGYGTYNFTDIRITDCHAYQMRSLSDLKRGCANFVVSNCTTRDMYDCHHTTDGTQTGLFIGCVGTVSSTTTIQNATFTNFIEVQGEHIAVSDCQFTGGGKTHDGVFVHDYGRPSEQANGHQVGHIAFKCVVRNCDIDNILSTPYRFLGCQECVVSDCEASFCSNFLTTIEASGSYDATGMTLNLNMGNEVGDINSKSCAKGVFIEATALHTIYRPSFDLFRNDFLYVPTVPSGSTTFVPAEIYPGAGGCADFRNASGINSLNRNPLMDLSGGSIPYYWGNGTGHATAAQVGGPTGVPTAVELTDTGGAAIWTLDSNAAVLLIQNEMLHFRFWLKQGASGAATKCGFRIREFNASNVQVGSDYWFGTNAIPSTWTEYVFAHTAQDAACAYIAISIAPAASFAGDAALTGTTAFADVWWSRLAIGQR